MALPGEQIACAQQNQPLAGGFASLEMPVNMPGQAQGFGDICYRHIGGNASSACGSIKNYPSARISANTSTSAASAMSSCARMRASCGRKNGLVARSRPICVGTVGLPSARRAVIFCTRVCRASLSGRHSRQRPHWRLCIHARNKRLWRREARRVLQALPHLRHGSFKNPPAAQHKQAVADKSVLRVGHVIGNMAQCVPAHIQHMYVMRAKLHRVAIIHFHINARNTLGLTCRADNLTAGLFLDLKIIAGMVKMMMRVPNMAQRPAPRVKCGQNRAGFGRVDTSRLPALGVVNQIAVIVTQARKLGNFDVDMCRSPYKCRALSGA